MAAAGRPSVGGFREFLTRTNALALAIGVIIGGASTALVNSLVKDIILPPIGWALQGVDFDSLKTVLGTTTADDGTVTEVAIRWGAFFNNLISFAAVMLVVYLIAIWIIREEEVATKECPFCLEANAENATKCRACGSAI